VVELETTVTNHAKDHRLRALFPTMLEVESSVAEGQFDVLERPIGVPSEWGPDASLFHPQQSWCDVSDGDQGLAILNQGLTEYEVYPTPSRAIALTLLRCVGTLSGGGDAPGAELTPEAQCQGTYTLHYAIHPHAGTWDSAHVWRQAHGFVAPLRAVQTDEQDGELDSTGSFLSLDPPELILTAVKRAEAGDALIVRFFNASEDAVTGTLTVKGLTQAFSANLLEEPGAELPAVDGAVEVTARAREIVTVLVKVG
jgi:alpha-mannosidase